MTLESSPTAVVSEFADTLRSLIDDTRIFSRDEWSQLLLVSQAAISQWLHDRTLPRASLLRSILEVVKRHSGASHPAVQRFAKITVRPADGISPLGGRMRPTLGHYLVSPVLDGFYRVLELIPPHQQEQVLFRAAAECRALLNRPTDDEGEVEDAGPTTVVSTTDIPERQTGAVSLRHVFTTPRTVNREAQVPVASVQLLAQCIATLGKLLTTHSKWKVRRQAALLLVALTQLSDDRTLRSTAITHLRVALRTERSRHVRKSAQDAITLIDQSSRSARTIKTEPSPGTDITTQLNSLVVMLAD